MGVVLDSLKVHHNGQSGIKASVGVTSITIKNCDVHNTGVRVRSGGGHGIVLVNVFGGRVQDNVIRWVRERCVTDLILIWETQNRKIYL